MPTKSTRKPMPSRDLDKSQQRANTVRDVGVSPSRSANQPQRTQKGTLRENEE